MFTLASLTQDLPTDALAGDCEVLVRDIAYDSARAQAGDVFVALRGALTDAHRFIPDAYARGVRTFVVDHWPSEIPMGDDITVARTPDTRHALALMSRRYFDVPERRMSVVAITGTKGKTTVSFMLRSIVEAADRPIGLIGSSGVHYAQTHVKLPNTTPESYQIHQILAEMVAAGVGTVILEATSQGFLMHRTDGMRFPLGVFTNISPDHISPTEHASFEEYFACKRQIFSQSECGLVNRDDPLYEEIVGGAPCPVRTFGFHPLADYRAEEVDLAQDARAMLTRFVCRTPSGTQPYHLHMPGHFNVSNALAAIMVADSLGVPAEAIRAGLDTARVPGRVEVVETPAPYTVLIDFAHNGLSLQALIDAVRVCHPRRVLAVFGLEGERSHLRRFDCGRILSREVDHTILSDASPRRDDPDAIIADIVTGMATAGGRGTYEIIRDRHHAIPAVLEMAGPGDIVLLIGKGSVTYEEVDGDHIPLDEREIVEEWFAQEALPDRASVDQTLSPRPS